MRTLVGVVLAAGLSASLPSLAQAKVHITVDLDAQTMHVVSADHVYDWRISSGKSGYDTPPGTYGVLWMDKDHMSDEYQGAPMPNAIFFKPGFAIHGAFKSDFGHPASHGCIRLPVAQSAILFDLVKAEGAEVRILGDAPATVEASARRRRGAPADYDAGTAYGYGYDGAPAYSQAPPGYDMPPQRYPGLGALFGSTY